MLQTPDNPEQVSNAVQGEEFKHRYLDLYYSLKLRSATECLDDRLEDKSHLRYVPQSVGARTRW